MMRTSRRHAFLTLTSGLLLSGLAFTWLLRAQESDQPGAYMVEYYRTNEVNIHLNTYSNRINILQFTGAPLSPKGTNRWTNMVVFPVLPFSIHHVITEPRTGAQRFYRLIVTN